MSELLDAVPGRTEEAARAVLAKAGFRDRKIVTAESCTGGLLASLLTDVEGASRAFERGFAAYSADAKTEMLGVSRELIDRRGTVSAEVAEAMAAGAIKRSHGDVALAITGFAGPAGPDDEPGLVYFACASRDEVVVRCEHFGDIGRGGVRLACLDVALDLIAQALER